MTEQELEKIFKKLNNRLIGYAYVRTKSISASKDIVQNAFIKLWKSDVSGDINSWLCTVIHNMSLNYLKHERVKIKNHEILLYEQNEEYVQSLDVYNEVLSIVVKEIKNLSNRWGASYKTVVKMFFIDGYRPPEIAQILNLSQDTIRTYTKRFRDLIKSSGVLDHYKKEYL